MSTLRKSYSLLRSDISLPVMCHHGEWSLPHIIRSMSLLSWSRVPESQMGQLMHTLLLHSFEAPRTKLVQPWGPVRLSLQWVWLWVGVGSVMSLQSWGPVLPIFQWVLTVWGGEICQVSHIVIVDREVMSLRWWPDVAVAPGVGKRRSFSCQGSKTLLF